MPGSTIDVSTLDEKQRERFPRNLRAVEQVLAGASQTRIAKESGISRTTLSRLVKRTRELGQIACVPHGRYRRAPQLHPAFQECIRRLYLLPTRLTMTAIPEHTEIPQVTMRLSASMGTTVKLPSYKQVRTQVHPLKMDPELVAGRDPAKTVPRIPAPPP